MRVWRSPGGKRKLNSRQRRALERQFEKGKGVPELLEYAERKYGVKRTTLYKLWSEWKSRGTPKGQEQDARPATKTMSTQTKFAVQPDATADAHPVACLQAQPAAREPEAPHAEDKGVGFLDQVGAVLPNEAKTGSQTTEPLAQFSDAPLAIGTTSHVQHAGSWLMLSGLMQLGLYQAVFAMAADLKTTSLRVVLDTLVVALSLGEHCVEGVRRVATPTAGVLLQAKAAPSASWVRTVLGRIAKVSARIHDAMAKRYLARGCASELSVFYIDNHMRKYTGKHTIRKGWRMQDKRAHPGTSDYYVHDIDGRPVLRVTEPSHGHLTDFLRPIANTLRRALGKQTQVLLAFDRGGAFPKAMAELRDEGIHFVTYERRPYPLLSPSVFEPEGIVRIGKKVFTIYENARTNLGKGRGRVRRIAVLTPQGTQINLVASSNLPAETLLKIMIGRWCQENGFKHGNERWGINQLDGHTVVHYDPDTVIPNPARRRLDNAIRIVRVREGDARRKLAQLDQDSPKRGKLEQQVADAVEEQRELITFRPQMPTNIELKNSESAGKLVHHPLEYKRLIDSVRIACANVESDLASMLAPSLPQPREAKKVLANLFAAPGTIEVSKRSIRVTLKPAATNGERDALAHFVERLDDANLALPADPDGRKLRFRIAR